MSLRLLSPIIIALFLIAGIVFIYFLNVRKVKVEKRLIAKMKASEERFRRLVELSPNPVLVHSGGEVLFVNEACLKMIHITDENEVLGKSVLDYVHPEFEDTVKKRMQQLAEGGKAEPLEQQFITPGGRVVDAEVTGVQIDFEGQPAIQLVMRDITEQKRVGRALEENRQRYESLFKNNPDAVFSMDRQGNLMDVNQSLVDLLGYSEKEFLAMSFHPVVHSEQMEETICSFEKALEGEPQSYDISGVHRNGDEIPLRITNMPIIVDNEHIGVFGIAKDISKEKDAIRLLEENEEKYRSLFDHNLDAVFEVKLDGTCKNANKMAEKLTHFSKEELQEMNLISLVDGNLKDIYQAFSKLKEGESIRIEQVLKDKEGNLIEADINAVPTSKKGRIDGVFGIVRDVTEKKKNQKQINELAFTDQLTGLPNRHWFYENLAAVVEKAKKTEQAVAVLIIDFDDFKSVNDLLGHHGGDLFLKKVAERLKSCIRPNDRVSRHGGDEFILVLEGVTEQYISRLSEKILKEMNQPVEVMDHELAVTISIGISAQSSCQVDEEMLIRQADFAMYSAKENGKNNYQFFTDDLNDKATRKLQLEAALRKAVAGGEFQLYYQPQVDLQTSRLVGLEALIRWNSPFGLVSPVEFIPIAEETGLIVPIGEWVIEEACRQIKRWESEKKPNVKVSVNMSARQFKDPDLIAKVKMIVEQAEVDTRFLEIEITESVMMDIEESSELIAELKKLGVKVAIDDFGAGYSSLNVIKNIEIDTLKIDKSLIDEVIGNSRNMSILTAIIDVGKNLQTEVIVEGIETKEQVEILKAFNVTGQGYFFSRPCLPEQLEHIWGKAQQQIR